MSGHDVQHLRFIGLEVLWWGRIGKSLEFLGGLAVVLDLVSEKKIDALHADLRARRLKTVAQLERWRRLILRRSAPGVEVQATAVEDLDAKPFLVAGIVVTMLPAIALTHYFFFPTSLGATLAIGSLTGIQIGMGVGAMAWFLYLPILNFVLAGILGRMESGKVLSLNLKWLGLWIFVAGFAMDLLSS